MPKKKKPLTCPSCRAVVRKHLFDGVCWDCFKNPKTRPAFDTASVAGDAPPKEKGRPPSDPTPFRPGTREKCEVMRGRLSRGECLFHKDDAVPGDDDDRTLNHRRDEDDDD